MKLRLRIDHGVGAALLAAFCLAAGPAMADGDAEIKGDAQAALNKVSMCIGCHGIQEYKAAYPELYHVPMIAGQNEAYIVAALKEYASGARTFPTMNAIASSMSGQDMADVAAYYANLK